MFKLETLDYFLVLFKEIMGNRVFFKSYKFVLDDIKLLLRFRLLAVLEKVVRLVELKSNF